MGASLTAAVCLLLVSSWAARANLAAPPVLGPACDGALTSIPDATAPPDATTWPHHDPLLRALIPDSLNGYPVTARQDRGADPDPARPDHRFAVATGGEPADFREVFATNGVSVVWAIRVEGVSSKELLGALLSVGHWPEPWLPNVTCEVMNHSGIPVLRVRDRFQTASFVAFADAWIVASVPAIHLDGAEEDLAAQVAAVRDGGVAPLPEEPPAVGTRVAPPASSADLAAALPRHVGGRKVDYVGMRPGQLGVGMVPVQMAVDNDPRLLATASELNVDPDTLWGDRGGKDRGAGLVDFSVLIDPDGDGQRWIEPYLAASSSRGGTEVASYRPRLLGGKDVLEADLGRGRKHYLYAAGPWFFLAYASSRAAGAEFLRTLPLMPCAPPEVHDRLDAPSPVAVEGGCQPTG